MPKVGLDDYIAAGGTVAGLAALITDTLPEPDNDPTPTFPLDVLPLAMRGYVAAAAGSLAVPVEMVAMPMLGFAGSLTGNRLHLILKNSWREYPTSYIAVVAPPGSAKTPALNLAKWPLDALQEKAHTAHRAAMNAHEQEIAAWSASATEARGPKPAPPQLRHYFSTDITIEALVLMLARSPGIAIVRDEIGSWVASMNQYRNGRGADQQQYLSLWSSQAIKADRKTGESIYTQHPVACVVGGIQPDIVGQLHHAAQQRDGFVERIIPLVPSVEPAKWTDEAPSRGQFLDVLALFEALDRIGYIDETSDDGEGALGIGTQLSPEARALFVQWHDENADLVGAAEGLAAGFFAKLPAHVARFALLLHVLWNADDPRGMLSAERMTDAIELGEFIRAHIGKFLSLLHATAPSQSAGLEARILRILRIIPDSQKNQAWLARSDIYRGLRNVAPSDLTTALEALRERGRVERRTLPTTTKPVEQWRLVPEPTHFTSVDYSQYSHYPSSDVRTTPSPERPLFDPNDVRRTWGNAFLWEGAGKNDQPGDDQWTR